MASIYDIKPQFQRWLRPTVRKLARAGITANQVTVAAALLSFLVGGLLCIFPESRLVFLLIPITLFLRMALNAIDGMLAREHMMQSRLGGILNELCDVLADAALFLPFALISGLPVMLIVVNVVLAMVAEMAGVVSVQIGGSRRYDGPMGKSDRAFAFGLLAFLLALGLSPGAWSTLYQWVILILLGVTIINRCRKALLENR